MSGLTKEAAPPARSDTGQKSSRQLSVTRTPECWNDLAWSTMQNLEIRGRNPGPDEKIVELFRNCLRCPLPLGTVYANPLFRVAAESPSERFVNKARWAQSEWRKSYCKFLGWSSRGWKQELKSCNAAFPLLAQLKLTGVMVMNNRQVHPKQWQRTLSMFLEDEQGQHNLVGQGFGKLLVIEKRPKGKWLCRCDCGEKKEVRGNHLRSGRTISCGCRRAEVQAYHERKRASRYR